MLRVAQPAVMPVVPTYIHDAHLIPNLQSTLEITTDFVVGELTQGPFLALLSEVSFRQLDTCDKVAANCVSRQIAYASTRHHHTEVVAFDCVARGDCRRFVAHL